MMLRPKNSAAIPVLEGEVKPLAKAISNTSASHLNVVQTLPSCEALERAHMIAGLERELNIPESIPAQDLNPELASWLAAYPKLDKPLKNNYCEYDPEIDYSKVYAFATKNSHAAKRRDHNSRSMPPMWENPNPVKGWHGGRCPTVMDLLNYAEKSANWDEERYTYWLEKYCVLSPERQVDPLVSANEETHELDTLGVNDKIWYVGESVRLQSWLQGRMDTDRNELNETVPVFSMPSRLESLYSAVPWTTEIGMCYRATYKQTPREILVLQYGEYPRYESWLQQHGVFNPPRKYMYRNPLKMYLHAVKRYNEHGEGTGERLVKLYHHLGIQPQFFVPITPKKVEKVEECNFILIGPPRETVVEKVARKVNMIGALPPPKQEYIPSDEAIDDLSENLSHGMYFSQSIARVIAKHVATGTVRDMLPAIEFSCRALVREEVQKVLRSAATGKYRAGPDGNGNYRDSVGRIILMDWTPDPRSHYAR